MLRLPTRAVRAFVKIAAKQRLFSRSCVSKIAFADSMIKESEAGNVAAVQRLLDSGAKVESKNELGTSALGLASIFGHEQVARLLLNRYANVEANEDGMRPLIWASIGGHVPVSELLLERCADINALSKSDTTALYHACYNAHLPLVSLLIARGARVNWGHHAIIAACSSIDKDECEDVDMSAFWTRRYAIVRLLIRRKANLTAVGPSGETSMQLAKRNNQPVIVAILQQALHIVY